jgi:hypothetical protein
MFEWKQQTHMQCVKPTGFELAQGGTKAPQVQNFAVNTHDKCAILAGTVGTQPALCAGTTKRQFVIFPFAYNPFFFEFWVQEVNPRRQIESSCLSSSEII